MGGGLSRRASAVRGMSLVLDSGHVTEQVRKPATRRHRLGARRNVPSGHVPSPGHRACPERPRNEQAAIHMIGNAHIDPVWLWQWPEGYQEVRATFQSAIDRMKEYPDFVFTCDSVASSSSGSRTATRELFEQIRARVAEGRFQIVGGWWIEPDCNIPSGESFVRQALYGQRYLREKFGVTATTGANLDSFGHNATIPQILARSGCDSYVFLRPGPKEMRARRRRSSGGSPPTARACSRTGSRTSTARRKDDIGEHVEKAIASLPHERVDELRRLLRRRQPRRRPDDREPRAASARSNERGDLPRLELSSLRRFFDARRPNGELPTRRAASCSTTRRGCYTTHSGIKRWNRRAENLLLRAEKWCAIADALGVRPTRSTSSTRAWKLVLFNQFHDTLAGTAIEPAYEDARDQLGARVVARGGAPSTRRCSRSRGRSTSSRRRRCGRSSSSTRTRGRCAPTSSSSTRGCARRAHTSSTTRASAVPMQLTRPLTTMSSDRAPARASRSSCRRSATARTASGTGAVERRAARRAPTRGSRTTHVLLELDPATRPHRAARAQGDGRRPRRAGRAARRRRRRPQRHLGPRRRRLRRRARASSSATSVRLLENGPGAGDPPRREPLRRVDAARGLRRSARTRRTSTCASTLDWHEQLKLLKLRYPTSVDARHGDVRDAVRPHRAAGERRRGAGPVVGRRLRRRPRADRARTTRSTATTSAAATSASAPCAARSGRGTTRASSRTDGDFEYMDQGRQTFLVRLIPHAGDWRDADVVAARGRAEPAAVRADRDVPRRAAAAARLVSATTAAATSS